MAPPADRGSRRELVLLLGTALLLFSARMGDLALPPLDDCFYARKAAEMAAHPGMTVTWAGTPAFQNPPGQIWVMAASFRAFGVNDGAARLPTALMAAGILGATAWIGFELLSPAAGLTAASLLAISPLFLNNARRTMMEIPFLFWTVLAIGAVVAARRRRAWLLLFALALGMAILVKSVLGLVPLLVALGAISFSREWRSLARDPRFVLATVTGVALGASWPLHQWLAFGPAFLDQHFTREIAGRSLRHLGIAQRVLGYPAILATQFQPVLLLAIPGAWALARRARANRVAGASPAPGASAMLLAWALAPILFAATSSAQSPRYVFPVFPALALLGGAWLAERAPRVAAGVRRAVPVLLMAGALVFWLHPQWLSRSTRDPFRDRAGAIRARAPEGTTLSYWGGDYWRVANPLLWYADRLLEPSAPSADSAVARARARGGLLVCDRKRLGDLPAEITARPWIEGGDVVVIDPAAAPR